MFENVGRSVIAALMLLGLTSASVRAQVAATGQSQGEASAQALRAQVQQLKQELEAIQRQYGERLAAIEARLSAIEKPDAATPAPVTPPEPVAAAAASSPAASKVFNPDIAVVGNLVGAAGRTPDGTLPAVQMKEAEVSLQAIVDPYARADVFIGIGQDGAALEEGYLTFTSLPGGLLAKVGRMHASFGKVNQMHTHVLPWADRPLVSANLVGGDEGLTDDGVSVSKLIPNEWMFVEATGEVFRGESALFRAPERSDLAYVGHVRAYRDLGEASNLDVGASVAYGHNGSSPTATTRLFGVDATFRFRPLQRAIYRRFLARTELIWSRRSELSNEPQSFGMYAMGEYQFGRRWYAGVRIDRSDRAETPWLTDKSGSLLLTYWPSEFSQIRTQFRRTHYGEGTTGNEVLFQVLFSIGAHGAHAF
jgi:hypothetical protein